MSDEEKPDEALSYSAVAWKSGLNPGSGHIHIGQVSRGRTAMAVFFALVLLAGAVGMDLVFGFRSSLQSMLGSGGTVAPGSLLGAVTFGGIFLRMLPFILIELTWFAVLADAMHWTREENLRRGLSEPPSPGVVGMLSMLSPGSGHLSAGLTDRGWPIVGGYALLKLVQLPITVNGVVGLFAAASAVKSMDPTAIQGLLASARALNGSLVAFGATCVWSLALADSVLKSRDKARPMHGGMVFLLGFLCPGAGHLALGAEQAGKGILGAYLGCLGLAGVLGATGGVVFGGLAAVVGWGSLLWLGVVFGGRGLTLHA